MNGTEKQNETSMEMPAEDSRVTMGNQTEKKHRFHLKMPQKEENTPSKTNCLHFYCDHGSYPAYHRPDQLLLSRVLLYPG